MSKYVLLDQLEAAEPFPGWKGKFVSTERMTFVYWDIPPGLELPAHSHPHEQVAHTFEGQFEICIDGVRQVLGPGSVAVIPPGAVHSGKALTACKIMDAFAPVREDYLALEKPLKTVCAG